MNEQTPPPQLTVRITWLGILNYLGAILTTGWMLYLIYRSSGTMYAVLALFIFGLILRFGASPLLVIAASVVYFHFGAGGMWLPLIAYVAAGLAFQNDLQQYRASQSARQ